MAIDPAEEARAVAYREQQVAWDRADRANARALAGSRIRRDTLNANWQPLLDAALDAQIPYEEPIDPLDLNGKPWLTRPSSQPPTRP